MWSGFYEHVLKGLVFLMAVADLLVKAASFYLLSVFWGVWQVQEGSGGLER